MASGFSVGDFQSSKRQKTDPDEGNASALELLGGYGGDDDSDADAGSSVSDDSSVEEDLERNEDYRRAMAEELSDWSEDEVSHV